MTDDKPVPYEERQRQRINVLETKLHAAKAVLAERESELLTLKGPCSADGCRLHYAHAGPCDVSADATMSDDVRRLAGGRR